MEMYDSRCGYQNISCSFHYILSSRIRSQLFLSETNTQKATQNSESPTDSTPMQSDDESDTSVKSTQETGPDVKESEEEESDAEDEPNVQDGPRYSYGDSDYLFDQDKLHTFELTLSDQNLAYLDSAPALEEYVPGTLTFEGETLPVGIRYKGSVGAWVGCLSGDGFLSTEGEKECTKLSTKVKINWEDSDDTFYEVKNSNFIHTKS